MQVRTITLFITFFIVSGIVRFSWIDWDQGHHLHPDERFINSVISEISLPNNLSDYFDGKTSVLNPRNQIQTPYVYGDVPIFLGRIVIHTLQSLCSGLKINLCQDTAGFERKWSSSNDIRIVGRYLSAFFSFATLIWIYLLGKQMFGPSQGLVALGLSGICVFLIQQGHFFTVDSIALFFTTAALYFFTRATVSRRYTDLVWSGIAVGIAVSCRINLLPLVGLSIFPALALSVRKPSHQILHWLASIVLTCLTTLITFRLAMPNAFVSGLTIDPRWIKDIQWAIDLSSPASLYPPAIQWTNRTPWIFPLKDIIFWGLGLGTGLAAIVGWLAVGYKNLLTLISKASIQSCLQKRIIAFSNPAMMIWSWTGIYFLVIGGIFASTMRYMLPIYPTLIVFASYTLVCLWRKSSFPLHTTIRRAAVVLMVSYSISWSFAYLSIYKETHPRIEASNWLLANLPPGTIIGVERWDDALPLSVDNHLRRLEFDHYANDTDKKRTQLLTWLNTIDYIALSSNRIYTSIPRQPMRFPLGTAYYRLLFSGEIGFDPIAEFSSYPKFASWTFPDQELGFAKDLNRKNMQVAPPSHRHVPYPPADEAFSVYDHPRVIIFKKNREFDSHSVAQSFSSLNLSTGLQKLTPMAESKAPTALLFDHEEAQTIQSSGTLSRRVNRNNIINTQPLVAISTIYLVINLSGWLLWPLTFKLLPGLRDRGWIMSRILAILLIAGISWWLTSWKIITLNESNVYKCSLVVLATSAMVFLRNRQHIFEFLRKQWRLILYEEVVFLVAFAFALIVRASNPDLWHPWFGGEKPMDFAILNALFKTESFPPADPFFSGGYINYYYFGFVLASLPIKLLGIAPEIGYQIIMAMFYALASGAVFSVAYTLSTGRIRPIYPAAFAVILVMLIGNLSNLHLLLNQLGGDATSVISNLVQNATSLSFSGWEWFWHATRVIQAEENTSLVTEFPFFTLLYGDLHAHFLALPLVFLSLGFALSWWRNPPFVNLDRKIYLSNIASLGFGGVVLGGLLMSNSWDFPTSTGLLIVALIISILTTERSDKCTQILASVAILILVLLTFTYPFRASFATGYNSIIWWQGSRTALLEFLTIHGIFLFPIFSLLWVERERSVKVLALSQLFSFPKWMELPVWFFGGLTIVLALIIITLHLPILLIVSPIFWLSLLMIQRPKYSKESRAWAGLVMVAAAITVMVEIVALENDVGRMNTVFKFYYQVWGLWGLCAAIALPQLWFRIQPKLGAYLWRLASVLLIGGGVFYTLTAIPSHRLQRLDPEQKMGLDGTAFMKNAEHTENGITFPLRWDYEALRWIQENIKGTPVVAEGRSKREYLWGNRVSVHTGLPSILGWRFHALQSRSILPPEVVEVRSKDVDLFFREASLSKVLEIIQRYDVKLIYIGPLERAYYPIESLNKFKVLNMNGYLELIYQNPGVDIYRVVERGQ